MADFAGLSPLHPKVISSIFVKKEQGQFLITQNILPEQQVEGIEFTHRIYGDVGGAAPIVADGVPTPLASVGYVERVEKCLEIREGDVITDRSLKFLAGVRDIIKDTVEFITERIDMRKEMMGFDMLLADWTAYGQHAALPITAGNEWDTANENILGDLMDANTAIKQSSHNIADTLLIGTNDENSMGKAPSLTTWNQAGTFGQQNLTQFAVGKIKQLDVFTSDVVYRSNQEDPDSALVEFLSDKCLVLQRGNRMGITAVAEAFESEMFPVKERRGQMLHMWQTVKPVPIRPTRFVQITNTHS